MENSNENNVTIVGDFTALDAFSAAEDKATEEAKEARKAANAAAKDAVKAHAKDDVASAAATLAQSATAIAKRFPVSSSAQTKLATQAVGLIAAAARRVVKG